jgi:hypothetical protein
VVTGLIFLEGVMVTLFASLIGFLGSIVPDVFKMINDKRDKRHELEIMDRQILMYEKGLISCSEEINANADIAEARIPASELQKWYSFFSLFIFYPLCYG